MEINGVGQRKLEVYGDLFIQEDQGFSSRKSKEKKEVAHLSGTYDLYKEGKSIEEIAELRKLKPTTIFSHLAKTLFGRQGCGYL